MSIAHPINVLLGFLYLVTAVGTFLVLLFLGFAKCPMGKWQVILNAIQRAPLFSVLLWGSVKTGKCVHVMTQHSARHWRDLDTVILGESD